ncbi:MAG: phage integrase SAM-like domain-containing protein [Ginsengibacter sp.]
MSELEANEQIGTASSCSCACVSLHKYTAGLKFEHRTPEFLRSYERWFIAQGKSITTVGIYLRSLWAVINVAIRQGFMELEDYPFGKRKYIIPSGGNIKKAFTIEEIAKIYNYETEPGSVDDSKRIINKWGQHELSQDTYVFPYLKPSMTPQKERDNIALLIHLINEHMKQIAAELGICKPITTYYARHSLATILKNNGVSTEFISEALGHTSLETTKSYLAGFEQDAIRKAADVLTSFINNLKIA